MFAVSAAGREAEDGLSQSAKPTPKACLKRVKFIVNNLRRYLRKLKVLDSLSHAEYDWFLIARNCQPCSNRCHPLLVQVLQPTRRKRLAPEGKEPKEPKELKEPKRFKYARAVEVPRDDDSRPILPLVLTDRLALVDLVSHTPNSFCTQGEMECVNIDYIILKSLRSDNLVVALVSANCKSNIHCLYWMNREE